MVANEIAPLLVIVGETASGKSQLAFQAATQFNGEIISADSWTIRRDLNIGTAKPTITEQAQIRHHLIDIIDVEEDFSAAIFKGLANEAIKSIAKKGKLPILVGGTGLYIDSVLFDFSFQSPPVNKEQREYLNSLNVNDLLKLIESRNHSLDGIDIRNKRRLIRLIETGGSVPNKQPLRDNTVVIGLDIPRDILKTRINERIESMIRAGLQDEVGNIVKRYGWDIEGLKGIGYSQWRSFYMGQSSLEETKLRIQRDTIELAKRQRTWFRRNKSIHWMSTPVNWTTFVDFVTPLLYK